MADILLSVSLVVYRTPVSELESLFLTLSRLPMNSVVAILDNFGDTALHRRCDEYGFTLLRPGENLGFGRGHDICFEALSGFNSKYHLIVNPDIDFNPIGVAEMISYMENNPDIGWLMPDICYPDGTRQHLCKLLASPFDLFVRRFLPAAWTTKYRYRYELRGWDHAQVMDIPCLSGCFMLLQSVAFREAGGFDDRYFMYMEDFDLCRRVGQKWRTVYYPLIKVVHYHAKGSYRKKRLLFLHIISAIRYFNKWGWFFDAYRKKRNRECMRDLGLLE